MERDAIRWTANWYEPSCDASLVAVEASTLYLQLATSLHGGFVIGGTLDLYLVASSCSCLHFLDGSVWHQGFHDDLHFLVFRTMIGEVVFLHVQGEVIEAFHTNLFAWRVYVQGLIL